MPVHLDERVCIDVKLTVAFFSPYKTATAYWTKNPVTNEFYQLNVQSALTWHQASQSCQQQESDLVSISEPHEHAYIAGSATWWLVLK